MWIVVGAVIGGLVFLGLLAISIPISLVWRLEVYDRFKISLRWNWLWGLISRDIQARRRPRKKRRKGFSLKKALRNLRNTQDFLNNKGLIGHFTRFLVRIFRRIHFRKLEAELRIGLGDPAETFYLFLLTEPANRLLGSRQSYPVNIRLSFDEPVLEGYFQGEARIYPIEMVPPVLALVFSAPAFRLIKRMVAARWKRNR